MSLSAALQTWIESHDRPARGSRVICGVSGGADSTALLLALAEIAPRRHIEVVVAHFDHGTRGRDAADDRRFVESMADDLGLEARVGRATADPAAGSGRAGSISSSPEARLRTQRLAFLRGLTRELDADHILLAHTREDQAETVLMRAVVGTSVTGLAAMREISPDGRILRPLLRHSRLELRAWLRERGRPWREDRSNRDRRFLRNRLRREVVPLLEEATGPGMDRALARLADHAAELGDLLEELGAQALEASRIEPESSPETVDGRHKCQSRGEIRLEAVRLRSYHPVVRRQALRMAIARITGESASPARQHLLAVDRLLEGNGEIHLPGGCRAVMEQGRLRILRAADAIKSDSTLAPGRTLEPGELNLPESGMRLRCEACGPAGIDPRTIDAGRMAVLDADRLVGPLVIRGWRTGDRFRPLGMNGSRLVSDLLTERRVPRSERPRVAVVTDAEGIIWVVGHRRSDRATIDGGTRQVLRLQVEPLAPVGPGDR